MVFVFLGLILSPVGFGWIDLTVDNKLVHVIAEVTLILVLFTDAARINLKSLWSDHDIPVRLLLVGMPLTILAGEQKVLAYDIKIDVRCRQVQYSAGQSCKYVLEWPGMPHSATLQQHINRTRAPIAVAC